MKKFIYNMYIMLVLLFLSSLTSNFYYSEEYHLESGNHYNPESLKTSTESGGGYTMNTDATYSWIEISSTGTIMNSVSDHYDGTQSLAFTTWNFTFYGTEYDTIYVSTNGWMSFTDDDPGSSYCDGIPGYQEENWDMIALFFTDLTTRAFPDGSGAIYYQFLTGPNRLVIEYYNISQEDDVSFVGDFEVILYESGNIMFQFKSINHIECGSCYCIGLDHGDGLNYNEFDEWSSDDTPISGEAIEFTISQMIPLTYGIGPEEDEEIVWRVKTINDTAMETAFGTNWEANFGLFANKGIEQKTKIQLSSISQNSTHWLVKYELWNWIDEDGNFDSNSGSNQQLNYFKDPNDNPDKGNLPDLFPLLIPNPCTVYMLRLNLSSFYDDIEYRNFITDIFFYNSTGSYTVQGKVYYNQDGKLDELYIRFKDVGNYQTILHLFRIPSDDKEEAEIPFNFWEFLFSPIGLIILGSIVGGIILGIVVIIKKKGTTIAGKKYKPSKKPEEKPLETTAQAERLAKIMEKSREKWGSAIEETKEIAEKEMEEVGNKCPKCGWFLSSASYRCPKCDWVKEGFEVEREIPKTEVEIIEEPKMDRSLEMRLLTREISEINNKIEILNQKYMNQIISEEEYFALKQSLYKKLSELQGKLSVIRDNY